ncbi:MAG TPA: 50S ribosomal protein L9 [Myxococcota bacterium]|nr:50S ribosomal protein L9 [Myxococcota bacterium]
MKLILREDVPSLGDAGDVVSVKPGFARNYLLPQGKAMPATDANVSELEHHKRVVAERVTRERRAFEAQRDRLQAQRLEFTAQAGEEGKLFGSVTASQIAEELAAKGIEIDRRKIQLEEPIREVGEHTVSIRLHREIVANVKVKVTAAE